MLGQRFYYGVAEEGVIGVDVLRVDDKTWVALEEGLECARRALDAAAHAESVLTVVEKRGAPLLGFGVGDRLSGKAAKGGR